MFNRYLLLLFIFLISLLDSNGQNQVTNNKDLKKLAAMMSGEFSSEAQSKQDSSFFHIMLRMQPIWKDRSDGYWLYVEQSVANMQDKPYRQRVYHLFIQDDTTIVSKVFEIKSPALYIGAWQHKESLITLSPDSLIDRKGCGIYLHKKSQEIFSGTTPGKDCLSSLRGAAYATSEVTIHIDKLVSWDRGWNTNDKQVWGAVKGGYTFDKLKKLK